jgi:hypothetical protein
MDTASGIEQVGWAWEEIRSPVTGSRRDLAPNLAAQSTRARSATDDGERVPGGAQGAGTGTGSGQDG